MNTIAKILKQLTGTKVLASAVLVAVIATGTYMIPNAKSKNRSYYSGDAINYNGKLVVVSTDMGSLELFKLTNNGLQAEKSINSFDTKYGNFDSFYSVALKEEQGRLFAFTVDGRYMYKYDISDLKNPMLVTRIKDTSWNWWMSLRIVDGKLVTIGNKSIQIWNSDLQVIDSYKTFGNMAYNYNFSPRGQYIFTISEGKIKLFNSQLRLEMGDSKLSGTEKGLRRAMNRGDYIYAVDNNEINKINFDGQIVKSVKHGLGSSFDVVPSGDSSTGYYSTGGNITKFNLETLKTIKSVKSTGWAMGMKNVGNNLVAFSGDYLTVYNSNLQVVGKVKSSGSETRSYDALSIRLDKNSGAANSQVLVTGQGFSLREPITITMAGSIFEAKTDTNGKFKQIISVPQHLPTRTDIKAVGENSKLTYSTTFNIE